MYFRPKRGVTESSALIRLASFLVLLTSKAPLLADDSQTSPVCSECPQSVVVIPELATECIGAGSPFNCWLGGGKSGGATGSPTVPPPGSVPTPGSGGGGGAGLSCEGCACPNGDGGSDVTIHNGNPDSADFQSCEAGLSDPRSGCAPVSGAPCEDNGSGSCVNYPNSPPPLGCFGDYGETWQDADGDGQIGLVDPFPHGDQAEGGEANPDFVFNASAMILTTDPHELDAILSEGFGSNVWEELGYPEVTDFDGDGVIVGAELIATAKAAVQEIFDAYGSSVNSAGNLPINTFYQFNQILLGATQAFLTIVKATDPIIFGSGSNQQKLIDNLTAMIGGISGQQDVLEITIQAKLNSDPLGTLLSFVTDPLTIALLGQGMELVADFLTDTVAEFINHLDDSFYLSVAGYLLGDNVLDSSTPDVSKFMKNTMGDPVNTLSGEFTHTVTDLFVEGRGLDLVLKRVYQSRSLNQGIVGRNWKMPLLETKLLIWPGSGGYWLELDWADGNSELFLPSEDDEIYEGQYGSFSKIRIAKPTQTNKLEPGCETCEVSDHPGFVLRQPNGTLFYFCHPSHYYGTGGGAISWLRKITDIHGNSITFKRDGTGLVYEIIDSLGRSVVLDYTPQKLLASITDPFDSKILYRYDEEQVLQNAAGSHSTSAALSAASAPLLTAPDSSSFSAPYPKSVKKELVSVTYPPAYYLDSSGVVAEQSPVESYEYDQSLDGWEKDSNSATNHNLKSIRKAGSGEVIALTYYKEYSDFKFDRVASHTIDGLTTTFDYIEQLEALPTGIATIITTMRSAEGRIVKYYHGTPDPSASPGLLLQTREFKTFDEDGDFHADSEQDTRSTNLEYDERYLLVRKEEQGKIEEWWYDVGNTDHFQRGNLLEQRIYSTSTDLGEAQFISTTYTYDPVTVQPRTVTDPIGRTVTSIFNHQELNITTAQDLFGTKDWGINLTQTTFLNGDLNGDGVLGGSFKVIRETQPVVKKASPTGPGNQSDYAPIFTTKYNSFGQMTAAIDSAGTETEFTYDGVNLTSIRYDIHNEDLLENFFYDSKNRVTSRIDTDGLIEQFSYDGSRRLIERRLLPSYQGSVASNGNVHFVTQYFYDRQGREIAQTKPMEQPSTATTYKPGYKPLLHSIISYDSQDHPVSSTVFIRKPDGSTEQRELSTTYDSEGNVVINQGPTGAVTETRYDGFGQPVEQGQATSIMAPYGEFGITRAYYANDLLSMVESSLDSDNNGTPDKINFEYDGYQRLYLTVDDLGRSVRKHYDIVGRVLSEQRFSATGIKVSDSDFAYDNLDRVVRTDTENLELREDGTVQLLTPSVRTRTFEYGSRANELIWTISDPEGDPVVSRKEYDSLGREVGAFYGTESPIGVRRQFDAKGRVMALTSVFKQVYSGTASVGTTKGMSARYQGLPFGNAQYENPAASKTSYSYDGFGRPSKTKGPSGEHSFYFYDPYGRISAAIEPSLTTFEYEYDSVDQVLTFTERGIDGLVRDTIATYNVSGQKISIADPLGQTTEFDYDPFARLKTRRLPDGSEIKIEYDLLDRPTLVTRPDGITQSSKYNGVGQLLSLTTNGTPLVPAVATFFDYDALGNQIEITDAVGDNPLTTINRIFSSTGDLLQERSDVAGSARTVRASYDAHARLTNLKYPSGRSVSAYFDELGRFQEIEVENGPSIAEAISYHGLYPSTLRLAGTPGVATLRRVFDASGREKTKEIVKANNATFIRYEFGYDNAGNLLKRDSTRGTLSLKETFTYDGFHRLRSSAVKKPNNQTIRNTAWQYDTVGNLTQLSDTISGVIAPVIDSANPLNQYSSFEPGSSFAYAPNGEETHRLSDGKQQVHTWDAFERLVSSSLNNGVLFDTVTYTNDGLGRLLNTKYESIDSKRYVYFGTEIVSIETPGGTTYDYVYGPHGIWQVSNTGQSVYLDRDPFGGNVTSAFSGGGIVENFTYTPYGELWNPAQPATPVTGSASGVHLFFVGKPHDFASGFTRLGVRFYDPRISRYINRDPLAETQGPNLYSYSHQNPFRWSDPTGLGAETNSSPSDLLPSGGGFETSGASQKDTFESKSLDGIKRLVAMKYQEMNLPTGSWDQLTTEQAIQAVSYILSETNQLSEKYSSVDRFKSVGLANGAKWLADIKGILQWTSKDFVEVMAAVSGAAQKAGGWLKEYAPGPSTFESVGGAIDALKNGSFLVGSILLTSAAVEVIPGVGQVAGKLLKGVGKKALGSSAKAISHIIPGIGKQIGRDMVEKVAYHHVAYGLSDSRLKEILASGLGRSINSINFLTPTNLSPVQAFNDLALDPERGLRNLRIEIDMDVVRKAGRQISSVTTVLPTVSGPSGRIYNNIGGGEEFTVKGIIPPSALQLQGWNGSSWIDLDFK